MDAKRDDGKAYSIAYINASENNNGSEPSDPEPSDPEPSGKVYSFTANSGKLAPNETVDVALDETYPAGEYKGAPLYVSGNGTAPRAQQVSISAYYDNGSTKTLVGSLKAGNKITTVEQPFNVIRFYSAETSYTYNNVRFTATSTTAL